MGPGPVNAHPRVLRAMSADLLGQFDPEMTGYMEQVMALYRPIFGTQNRWTMLVDGTARAGIEAALVSLVAPGDTVLVVNFGRFGLLLTEILQRIGARIETVEAPWGETVPMDAIAEAIHRTAPHVVATIHGDTSTTMAQPLEGFGALCRAAGALSYVDATATIGGMELAADRWDVDVVTGGCRSASAARPARRRLRSPRQRQSTSLRAVMSRRVSACRALPTGRGRASARTTSTSR